MMVDENAAKDSVEEKGLDRILGLSDGVFAFAVTLLVLGLAVPALAPGASRTSASLYNALAGEANAFEAYAISFFIASIWWVAHHRIFRYVKRYDTALMWRNLFFLLFITIIPFMTELIDQYGDLKLAVVIYDGSQLLGGLALSGVWRHIATNHLYSKDLLTEAQVKQMRNRGYIPILVFGLAIVIALALPQEISPSLANLVLFAMFPLQRRMTTKNEPGD